MIFLPSTSLQVLDYRCVTSFCPALFYFIFHGAGTEFSFVYARSALYFWATLPDCVLILVLKISLKINDLSLSPSVLAHTSSPSSLEAEASGS